MGLFSHRTQLIKIMAKPEFSILVISGDGIGPEVCDEAVAVLDLLSSLPNSCAAFRFVHRPFSSASIDKHGIPVINETLEQGKVADVILIGSVGGPE